MEKKLSGETALPAESWENWRHDEAVHRDDFIPVRSWVDHDSRALGHWPPPSINPDGSLGPVAEDSKLFTKSDGYHFLTILLLLELDLEYKYWAFMESHPAHMPLPFNAYADALDALTWSYTGN